MANHQSALKRHRQSLKRRARNRFFKSTMRTTVKKFLGSVTEGNKDNAGTALQQAVSIIDKVAGKGMIHKNKAARTVSRLVHRMRAAFPAA